jgi:peptide-methionine (S)-S-oxide reductase
MFGLSLFRKKATRLDDWVPGRAEPVVQPGTHHVSGRPLTSPWPAGHRTVLLGLGCFWGAERLFWQKPGVWVTAAGYAGGSTPNPTYYEVCSGGTGHAEVVLVAYDPRQVKLEDLLKAFFEAHDPTQGMRQGNDVGSQYRSCIFLDDPEERELARRILRVYEAHLARANLGPITTTIGGHVPFYYAEDEHQQYLAKKPWGYCGLSGTGIACPTGLVSGSVSA